MNWCLSSYTVFIKFFNGLYIHIFMSVYVSLADLFLFNCTIQYVMLGILLIYTFTFWYGMLVLYEMLNLRDIFTKKIDYYQIQSPLYYIYACRCCVNFYGGNSSTDYIVSRYILFNRCLSITATLLMDWLWFWEKYMAWFSIRKFPLPLQHVSLIWICAFLRDLSRLFRFPIQVPTCFSTLMLNFQVKGVKWLLAMKMWLLHENRGSGKNKKINVISIHMYLNYIFLSHH